MSVVVTTGCADLGTSADDILQVTVANALCSDVQWQSPELITCTTTPVDSYQQGPVVVTLITGGVATSVHQFQYPSRTWRFTRPCGPRHHLRNERDLIPWPGA